MSKILGKIIGAPKIIPSKLQSVVVMIDDRTGKIIIFGPFSEIVIENDDIKKFFLENLNL